jgi:hypothetical protein
MRPRSQHVDTYIFSQSCHKNPNLKAEVPDVDLDMKVMTQCTKCYFWNIQKQAMSDSDTFEVSKG